MDASSMHPCQRAKPNQTSSLEATFCARSFPLTQAREEGGWLTLGDPPIHHCISICHGGRYTYSCLLQARTGSAIIRSHAATRHAAFRPHLTVGADMAKTFVQDPEREAESCRTYVYIALVLMNPSSIYGSRRVPVGNTVSSM